MLGALDSLRAHAAESLGETSAPITATPRHADPVDELFRDTSKGAVGGEEDQGPQGPQGSEKSENPGPGAVPPSRPVYDVADDKPAADAGDDEDPPMTATEAFLRSAHIDHGDPPLPPMDDAEVGARYARDAMRATARAKTGREDQPRQAGADRDASGDDEGEDSDRAEATGKPLGWLFRSSS
jgi:hypothetical protein